MDTVDASQAGDTSATRKMAVMDIRVKEVPDLSTFWAQIGTPNHLAVFDAQQAEMSAWCEKRTSHFKTTFSLKLEDMVAVRGEKKGTWVRAKVNNYVNNRLVDLFFVDIGSTGYVDINDICCENPPMLLQSPQQALQCTLSGITLVDQENKAKARFIELTSAPVKAIVHKILEGSRILLTIFIPYEGQYLSVGEILKKEGLVKYEPLYPTTLDIPVPVHSTRKSPVLAFPSATESSDSEDVLFENYSPPASKEPGLDQDPYTHSSSSVATITPCATPVNAHHVCIGGGPMTPPLVPPTKEVRSMHTPSVPASDATVHVCTDQGVISDKAVTKSTLLGAEVGKAKVSEIHGSKPDRPLEHENGTSRKDPVIVPSASSGSSPSDNDWLDEDLLPRRSRNFESSADSPLKDGLLATQGSGLATQQSTSWEYFDNPGNTPHPASRHQSRLLTSSRNLRGAFLDAMKDKDHQQSKTVPRGRGRGDFMSRAGRSEDYGERREWSWRGKGRGSQDKAFGNSMQPPFRRFPKNTTQSQQAPRHFENTPSSDEKSSMVFTQPKSQQKIEHASSSHNLLQCAPAVGTKDVPVGTTLTYSDQISGTSDQDETKWQTWKIEKEINKILSSLDMTCIGKFSRQMEELTRGSTAEKLPKSKSPMEIIVQYTLKEAIFWMQDLQVAVAAVDNLIQGPRGKEAYQTLWTTLNKMAHQITESTSYDEGKKKCQVFCKFLGSLFARFNDKSKYKEEVVACISDCLNTWSRSIPFEGEQQQKLRALCFGFLIESGSLLSDASTLKEIIIKQIKGPIRESIVCRDRPMHSCEVWFDVIAMILEKCCERSAQFLVTTAAIEEKIVEQSREDVTVIEAKTLYDDNQDNQKQVADINSTSVVSGTERQVTVPHPRPSPSSLISLACPLPPHITSQVPPAGTEKVAMDSYTQVMIMLEKLNLLELLPKFRAALIKDSVLDCDVHQIRECLKEAGIPAGAVVEIMQYLESSKHSQTDSYAYSYQQQQQQQPSQPPSPADYLTYSNPQPPSQHSQQSSPVTPGSAVDTRHYNYSNACGNGSGANNSSSCCNIRQQKQVSYQMENSSNTYSPSSLSGRPDLTIPEGVFYTGASQPASPMLTSHQMMLPPPLGHPGHQVSSAPLQQQQMPPQCVSITTHPLHPQMSANDQQVPAGPLQQQQQQQQVPVNQHLQQQVSAGFLQQPQQQGHSQVSASQTLLASHFQQQNHSQMSASQSQLAGSHLQQHASHPLLAGHLQQQQLQQPDHSQLQQMPSSQPLSAGHRQQQSLQQDYSQISAASHLEQQPDHSQLQQLSSNQLPSTSHLQQQPLQQISSDQVPISHLQQQQTQQQRMSTSHFQQQQQHPLQASEMAGSGSPATGQRVLQNPVSSVQQKEGMRSAPQSEVDSPNSPSYESSFPPLAVRKPYSSSPSSEKASSSETKKQLGFGNINLWRF